MYSDDIHPDGWTTTVTFIGADGKAANPETFPHSFPNIQSAIAASIQSMNKIGIDLVHRDKLRGSDDYYRVGYGFQRGHVGMPRLVIIFHQHKHKALDIAARIAQRADDERTFDALTANIELH